jgi:hypothetical protein
VVDNLTNLWLTRSDNQPLTWEPTTLWESKMTDITWSFVDGAPRFRNDKWRAAFENQKKDDLFKMPLEEQIFPFTKSLTVDQLWSRYCTLSQIHVLDAEAKEVNILPLRSIFY